MDSDRVFKIVLPFRMNTTKKKIEGMNLNIYRNLFHYSQAHQKRAFHDAVLPLIRHIPKLGQIKLHYEINPKTRRRLDTMNVGSIVDKYFSDTLVEAGIIEDDDYKNVVFNSFCFGSLMKNENVLVTITEIKPRTENIDMRILLDQDDIQQALDTYVESKGIAGSTGVELTVDSAGNINAEVMIGGSTPSKPTTEVKQKRTRRSKAEMEAANETVGKTSTGGSTGDDSGDSTSAENDTVQTEPSEEGKKSKNLSKESPEESSTDSKEEESVSPPVKTKATKKGSIFDV